MAIECQFILNLLGFHQVLDRWAGGEVTGRQMAGGFRVGFRWAGGFGKGSVEQVGFLSPIGIKHLAGLGVV